MCTYVKGVGEGVGKVRGRGSLNSEGGAQGLFNKKWVERGGGRFGAGSNC